MSAEKLLRPIDFCWLKVFSSSKNVFGQLSYSENQGREIPGLKLENPVNDRYFFCRYHGWENGRSKHEHKMGALRVEKFRLIRVSIDGLLNYAGCEGFYTHADYISPIFTGHDGMSSAEKD